MKTFIKNIKGIALGLAVMGLAIGFSAFKSAQENLQSGVTYYQTSPGFYEKIVNPTGNCVTPTALPCSIHYEEDPGVNQFDYVDRPDLVEFDGTESEARQIYIQ